MKKILVTGASGFVGQALIKELLQNPEVKIVALSRSAHSSDDPRVEWRECDLFSFKDVRAAIRDVDVAYYLVHSMLPSASLSQGSFYDLDLIMADNFAKAAKLANLKQIIYLGGLVPRDHSELSWHLKSRLEVEEELRSSGLPVTAFRAGLIIGPNSSSFFIVKRLLERLPVMVLPDWTKTKMQPIALSDAITALVLAIGSSDINRVYDLGGSEVITYRELICRTAAVMKKNPTLVNLNLIPIGFSSLWVSFITGAPRDLVKPLIWSLQYPMTVRKEHAWPFDHPTDLESAIKSSLIESPKKAKPQDPTQSKTVRSVQRLILPQDFDAVRLSEEYFKWLPRLFRVGFKVETENENLGFNLFGLNLLTLKKITEYSEPSRQVMLITGGFLSKRTAAKGRLEFRTVLGGKVALAAIHDYEPSLPWDVYKNSQALFHLGVMSLFSRHLSHISEDRAKSNRVSNKLKDVLK